MEAKTPPSLQRMLSKSLATFQSGMAGAPEGVALKHGVFQKQNVSEHSTPPTPPDTAFLAAQAQRARLLQVVEAYALDGDALLEAALTVDAAGKEAVALFLYELSLAVHPDARAYNNIAVLYAEDDAPQDALEWLERGLEHFPRNAILLENYEALSQEEGKVEEETTS